MLPADNNIFWSLFSLTANKFSLFNYKIDNLLLQIFRKLLRNCFQNYFLHSYVFIKTCKKCFHTLGVRSKPSKRCYRQWSKAGFTLFKPHCCFFFSFSKFFYLTCIWCNLPYKIKNKLVYLQPGIVHYSCRR